MKPFSIDTWTAERARVAGLMASGVVERDEGQQQLAVIDEQLARLRTVATQRRDGAFQYARPASEPRSPAFAFMSRFARAPRASADVGVGGLVTTDNGVKQLCLYGPIGFGFGIAASDVARALDEHNIALVRLNSPGGDVFDGIAIAGMIEKRGLPVLVDGVAASIASVIAAASPQVRMAAGSFMMIHRAWSAPVGNAEQLRKEAGVLDKLDASMSDLYARKAGETPQVWLARMSVETWYAADEAVAAGLADVTDDEEASGLSAARAFAMNEYHAHVPRALVAA